MLLQEVRGALAPTKQRTVKQMPAAMRAMKTANLEQLEEANHQS